MTLAENKKYFDVLQIFRGVAALMIIIHHSKGSFLYYHHADNYFLDFISSIGKLGVDFFFVLSGFIISYTSFNKQGDKKYIKSYLIKRILRIYVPYLPVSFLMLFLYFSFPNFSSVDRSFSLLTSLTLFPDGNPALSVAWTLIHEMLFYFLFLIFFFSKKKWDVFVLIWVFLILVYNYILKDSIQISNSFLRVFLSLYNIEFVLGYVLATVIKRGYKINNLFISFLFFSSFALFLYLIYWEVLFFDFYLNILFSLSCFFLIYWSINDKNIRINNANVFMMIGNATYSIYLIHNPLQALMIRFLPASTGNDLMLFGELFIVTIVCCIIGYIYYLIFEKHLLSKMNSIFLR